MTEKPTSLREKLLRKQFYAIFMEPPEPVDDPIAAFGNLLEDHLRFLADLENRGILFCSGPFRDGQQNWKGDGMAIIRASDFAAAEDIAFREPFHKAGIRRNRVSPWQMNEGGFALRVRIMDGSFEVE
jgi:uncharacterized protein YciI